MAPDDRRHPLWSMARMAFRSSAGIFGRAAAAGLAITRAATVATRSPSRLISVACHVHAASAYSVAVSGDAEDRIRADRIAKVGAMRAAGVDPYPARTPARVPVAEVRERFGDLEAGAETDDAAGRGRADRRAQGPRQGDVPRPRRPDRPPPAPRHARRARRGAVRRPRRHRPGRRDRCRRRRLREPPRRAEPARARVADAGEVPAAAPREVARPDRHRAPPPAPVRRPDRERGLAPRSRWPARGW